jgi:hypothetical protein
VGLMETVTLRPSRLPTQDGKSSIATESLSAALLPPPPPTAHAPLPSVLNRRASRIRPRDRADMRVPQEWSQISPNSPVNPPIALVEYLIKVVIDYSEGLHPPYRSACVVINHDRPKQPPSHILSQRTTR